MTLDPLFGRTTSARASVLRYQVPTVAAYLLAVATLPFSEVVTSGALIAVGIVVFVLASVAAVLVPWQEIGPSWAILVPLVSMAAVGCLRMGTGGSGSPYSSLLFLPFVWIAMEPRRRSAALAALALCAVTVVPPLFSEEITTSADIVKAFFSPAVYGLIALVINEITRRLRLQLSEATASISQREKLLDEAVRASQDARRNEARADAATRLFTGIWEAVTEQSIIGTDLTGEIDSWNPGATKMLGLSQDEVLDDDWSITRIHRADELDARLAAMSRQAREAGGATHFCALVQDVAAGSADVREWTYVRPDGTELSVQVAATPRLDEDDQVVGYLFVATDMTKAKEFARLKDEFVGMISHELRTPLSSILGYLELLRDQEEGPLTAEQLQYLDIADRNAHRLLSLVGDLLFTAQVEAGQFPLEVRPTALDAILAASVESARPVAGAAAVRLVLDLPEQPVEVRADPMRLAQAVDNLLSNAVKFTPADGLVTVALSTTTDDGGDERVLITVADTGMGIPEDELDQLTNRFFRASTATSSSVPGIGLGLAITKAIVLAHRGRLDIASTVGEGTAFTIDLPLTELVTPGALG